MDERQKHPAPTAEPTGRSPTINVRRIDRLVVEGKASAANDGHPQRA